MNTLVDAINRFIWGVPSLILIVAVGVLLSLRTGWAQFRLFPTAIKAFFSSFKKSERGEGISSYGALCTALAATVGTGNLAGVGGAIAIGGPGAIFWMWICAILGMVTKFAEATLSVRYRVKDSSGNFAGGPMYIVQRGLSKKWLPLGGVYCFFGVIATFGVGSATQINAVVGGINGAVIALGGQETVKRNILIGFAISGIVALVLLGGARRISAAASCLVPFASVFYIVLCVGVLIICANRIPQAFSAIICGAFSPQAVTGGVVGSVFQVMRIGASRGVFTNEAGMGTAGMAHSSAQVSHPIEQGMMGIVEVFLDTIIICTLTGLVILCSGIGIPFGKDLGIRITANAFSSVYGNWIQIPIAFALCCFAVATIFGWGLYGIRCAQYLFGEGVWKNFVILQCVFIVLGSFLGTGVVWSLSEIANGLMAIPNLLILVKLCPELVRLLNDYSSLFGRTSGDGGTNENFKKS